MLHPSQLSVHDYTYELPNESIAYHPLSVRHNAKLLVYNYDKISDDIFLHLDEHLNAGSLLVVNNSKVIKARLNFYKPSGGQIEIFLLEPLGVADLYHAALYAHQHCRWKCLVGNAAKWKEGSVSASIKTENREVNVFAEKIQKENDAYVIEFSWNDNHVSFLDILSAEGKMPLPPYIKREADESDEKEYQTVYAKEEGSVAAPTAGLHFTGELLKKLNNKGIEKAEVTLHVGAGTFKPVKANTMSGHIMHGEFFEISLPELEKIITAKEIVAVGTTSLRTLESLYWLGVRLINKIPVNSGILQWEPYESNHPLPSKTEALNALKNYIVETGNASLFTSTQILIAPGYQFRVVNKLITNFHQPNSTLLLLVAAAVGNNWRKIYEHALNSKYRFLSYGDGSLLEIAQNGGCQIN